MSDNDKQVLRRAAAKNLSKTEQFIAGIEAGDEFITEDARQYLIDWLSKGSTKPGMIRLMLLSMQAAAEHILNEESPPR